MGVSVSVAAKKDNLWSVHTFLGNGGCHGKCSHGGDGGDDGGELHVAWIMCRKKWVRSKSRVDFGGRSARRIFEGKIKMDIDLKK